MKMAAQKMAKFGQKIVTKAPALATKYTFQGVGLAKKAQPHLAKFWSNAKVELAPPKPSDWPLIRKELMSLKDKAFSGKFLDLTVKEAVANGLVAVEIAMWFYVGEIIGRRSLIGYNV